MTESLAYWLFGFALSGALAVAVGRQLVEEHGRRVVPLLCLLAVILGALLGWALDGFIAYVRLSESTRY